jgi:hypothetical protein
MIYREKGDKHIRDTRFKSLSGIEKPEQQGNRKKGKQ